MLLLVTVTGDNPLNLSVILSYDECTELIDIDCIAFEAVFECPYLHPVFKGAGKAFPFPDDRFVFATFDKEVPALELLEDACQKRCTVHFMPDFGTDRSDVFLQRGRELVQRDIYINADAQAGSSEPSLLLQQALTGGRQLFYCQ